MTASTRRAARRCTHAARARRIRALARSASVRRSAKPARRPAPHAVAWVSGGLIVGLANVDGWGKASTRPRMAQVRAQTHTKWLREEFRWNVIEPPGQFDFSYYDHFMLIAAQAGEHVLPLMFGTPSWAGATDSTIPSDPSAYAQFVAAVVARYGPSGSFWNQYPSLRGSAIQTWEIWNEPYYDSGGDYNPGDYARLVKATASPATPPIPTSSSCSPPKCPAPATQTATGSGGLTPSIRPCRTSTGTSTPSRCTPTATTPPADPIVPGQPYSNYRRVRRIEDIHQQFINHGASEKPFWITESGWSTCTNNPDCVSPAQQAANLTTLFADLHGRWKNLVQAAFLYPFQDGCNPNTNIQGAYGLTPTPGDPKPALQIFRTQAALSAN